MAVPPMDDEKVERVQAELERLFGDDDEAPAEAPAPDTPPTPSRDQPVEER